MGQVIIIAEKVQPFAIGIKKLGNIGGHEILHGALYSRKPLPT